MCLFFSHNIFLFLLRECFYRYDSRGRLATIFYLPANLLLRLALSNEPLSPAGFNNQLSFARYIGTVSASLKTEIKQILFAVNMANDLPPCHRCAITRCREGGISHDCLSDNTLKRAANESRKGSIRCTKIVSGAVLTGERNLKEGSVRYTRSQKNTNQYADQQLTDCKSTAVFRRFQTEWAKRRYLPRAKP